jgi:hypothetical protein
MGELRESLSSLSDAVEFLAPLEKSQKTLLSVANRGKDEVVWNRVLRYLLDPSECHGLSDDVLRYFLTALHENGAIGNVPSLRSGEVRVNDQVQMDDGDVDIVICEPERWFICIEMKVWGSEGPNQTTKYARSTRIDEERVDDYLEANRDYVYLTRPSDDKPISDEFERVTWDTIARNMRRSISEPSTNQSALGQAQVRDFTNTIINQFNLHMGPQSDQEPIRNRMELYHEYRREIQDLEKAFKEFCREEKGRWEGVFSSDYEPEGWSDEWYTRTPGEGQIYHRDWVVDPDGPGNLDHSPFIHFEFPFDAEGLKEGQLEFSLSVTGRKSIRGIPDDRDWAKKINTIFENSGEFNDMIPDEARTTIRKRLLLSKTYRGVVDKDAFYCTLVRAFEEFGETETVVTEIVENNVP